MATSIVQSVDTNAGGLTRAQGQPAENALYCVRPTPLVALSAFFTNRLLPLADAPP